MTQPTTTIIFPVKDVDTSKQIFAALLGVAPSMDEPYYVGFDVDGQHIGLDPSGHDQGMTGPVPYWHVDDINASLSALVDAGAEQQQPATDVGGGKLVASVKDADGNVVGLIQAG